MSVQPPPLSPEAFRNFVDGSKKGAEVLKRISGMLELVRKTNPDEAERLGKILDDWAVVTMRIEANADRMIRLLSGRACSAIAKAARKCTDMAFEAAVPSAPKESPSPMCAVCLAECRAEFSPSVFFSFQVKEREEDVELVTKTFTTCAGRCADFALRVYCYSNFGERIRTVPGTPLDELRREFDACERTVCDKDI